MRSVPEAIFPVYAYFETSTNSLFVILSEAKDLVFPCIYEILRSLRSLRMTGEGTFAGVSFHIHRLAENYKGKIAVRALTAEKADLSDPSDPSVTLYK